MLGLVLAVGLFMSSCNSCGETCSVSVEACCQMEGAWWFHLGLFLGFLVARAGWVEPGPCRFCWCMGVFLKWICNSPSSPLTYINFNLFLSLCNEQYSNQLNTFVAARPSKHNTAFYLCDKFNRDFGEIDVNSLQS